MKVLVTVSQAEMDIISELETWGWLIIPKTVDLVVSDNGASVLVHPSLPTSVGTGVAAGTAVAAAGVVKTLQTLGVVKGGFDPAFEFVIEWEGGYTNDANDPGGPTMYGIDTKDDSAAWKALGVTDVKNLTLAQAKGIYLEKYWNKSLCNTMPTPVAETHFNYSVNVGSSRSVEFMQTALGIVVDGAYGPITQTKLIGFSPAKSVALGMVNAADTYYRNLATQRQTFESDLVGWLNRNTALRTFIETIS